MLSAVTVRDAWCQILNWTGPSSEAQILFLERQLEAVPNYGDEDLKLFFSKIDQLLTRLRSVDVHKTEKQIVNILVRNLSDYYEIEKRSRVDSPFLRRRDVKRIVRASWATRQTRQLQLRSASGVTPNPHALVASRGFQTSRGGYGGPRRDSGRSSGSGRGIQQSWFHGGGNHHVNHHQQQQHLRPPPKPLAAILVSAGHSTAVPMSEGGPKRNRRPRPTARGPTGNGAGKRDTRPGSAGHMTMAAAMAPTAAVPTITADTAMPSMKRCQLDSRLAPAPAPVMTYHYGRREPLMAAAIELCSRQATEETVSPLRLRTGATRMKDISVVLFPPFSVARNRVVVPLLISCSFQPAVAAVAPAVISRGPHRSTAVVTTATVPIEVHSSSTAAVVVVIMRNRSCETTAAATVQHCGRSSSMTPAPSVALAGSRGALATIDRP